MDKFIGKRLDGRYLIQTLLGSGGMAVVYKAVDLKENKVVAVKILREECMNNEDLVRRFKNESKAISVLNHPNLVKVYDVSVSDKLQFIVMEYIDGITLKDYMEFRKQPLTYKETLHFVSQTLLALQHAHAKGIVHRDIKPQNIMLLANGNIKVMDFGIARFARNESQTMTDKAIGSVHYISPEQAKGDVTDLKADIYSVGVMMYEMLSGRLPFEGESPVGIAIKQISDAPTPLRQINPAVPEALQAITERAMAKEPRERYQSAGAMLADIEAFKRNPSIKFEYQYLTDNTPTRYMDKAVSKTPQRRPEQNRRQSGTGAARRPVASSGHTRRSSSRHSLFKKKWLWPVMAGACLAFVLVSILSCYLILKNTVLFTKAKDLELPNFVKMTRTDVENNSSFKEFTQIEFEEVPDAENPAGTIVSQTPKPPKTVKSTARIILRVSIGITQVSVPDIVGKDQAAGLQAMKDAGFNVMLKRREVENKTDPFGNVLELTLPDGTPVKAGQVMDSGTTILVYVSAEHRDDEVKIPQCVGLANKEEALTLLASRNLSIGSITEEDSTAPAGSIIRQSPEYVETTDPKDKAGMVKKGSLIDLVISKGHTHTYAETARTEPQGCETPGIITYTCSVCGDVRTEPIPAHGHDWGEWTLTTPPTTTADGVETRTCKRDANHTEKRAIPKLPSTGSSSGGGGSSSSGA